MKLIFDQNLSFKLCSRLADRFPESTQVRLVGLDAADDRTIWEFAKSNSFTIVTQDSVFAEMATLYGPPPKVIWLRCGNQSIDFIETLIRDRTEQAAAFAKSDAACWELY